jgi:hypothetical protein
MTSLKCLSAAAAKTAALTLFAGLMATASPTLALAADGGPANSAQGLIKHILVIDLENENYGTTFGPSSPAVYLNKTLLNQGELIVNYFATSHVSLGNYISQVSGQEPTVSTNNDCLKFSSLAHPPALGTFNDVTPGTDAADQTSFPGQVVGDGCVYPAPSATSKGAMTIGDQLDAMATGEDKHRILWREYAEDMGLDAARDHGDPDPRGMGRTCAHPALGGDDLTNTAEAADQYADRHNPFIYFHSVIDDAARCDSHVVPLGALTVGHGSPDIFRGQFKVDLSAENLTPDFMFVTPNLCNDGHDATCAGPNVEGTVDASGKNVGGLVSADLWLKHYMPMIFASPAYKDGSLLVVLTFDEAGSTDARACPDADQSTCKSPTGPNVSNPGFSSLLAMFGVQTTPTAPYVYAGGGQVGAVVFNSKLIKPGSVNTTGYYNHYSALRTYEDLLGIDRGGDDGKGHLGYAAVAGLATFGPDVFNNAPGHSSH